MPIVQAGKTFTAADLKLNAGNLAAALRDAATNGMQLKAQLDTWPDADLVTLGLTQTRAGYNDRLIVLAFLDERPVAIPLRQPHQ